MSALRTPGRSFPHLTCASPHASQGEPTMSWIHDLLGKAADDLLEHRCRTIPREMLHVPGPDFLDRIFIPSDRNQRVLANLQRLHGTGRLAGTGYVSILPVDQGI